MERTCATCKNCGRPAQETADQFACKCGEPAAPAPSSEPSEPPGEPSNADPLHLSRILHELAGAASLCWTPRPSGVFDSQEAINHVEAAIAEIRSRAAPQWQDISAAPKDGREVWAFNGEQARMKWIEGDGYALWVWADELLCDIDPSPTQPTHWIPLPSSPTGDKHE